MAQLYEKMHARLLALANSTFQTAYIQPGITCLSAEQAKIYWKGFRGPLCFNSSQFPVVPTPPPTSPPGGAAFQLTSPNKGLCLVGKRLGLKRCSSRDPPQWEVGDPSTGELKYAVGGDLGLCVKMHEEAGWNCANTDGNKTEAFIGHCSGASGSGAHKTNFFYLDPAGNGRPGSAPDAVLVKSHDCPELCLARVGADTRLSEVGLVACSGSGRASATWLRS